MKRVQFTFDERSLWSLTDLAEKFGDGFCEVFIRDPNGSIKTMHLPSFNRNRTIPRKVSMDEKKEPGQLESWAIVEVMGHQKFAGFVQTVPMGGAAMIRVDVPEIPAYQQECADYDYDAEGNYRTIKKIREIPAAPAFTKFLGVSSIFALTPCSQELATEAVRQFRSPPVSILQMPERKALAAPEDDCGEPLNDGGENRE